jgi:hypothetical protein
MSETARATVPVERIGELRFAEDKLGCEQNKGCESPTCSVAMET